MLKLVEICTHTHTHARMWWYAVFSDAAAQQGPLGLSIQLCGEMDQHWLWKDFGHTPHVVSWMVAPSLPSPSVHVWFQSSCPMLTERKVCLRMALDSNGQAQGYRGSLIDLCHFFVSASLRDIVSPVSFSAFISMVLTIQNDFLEALQPYHKFNNNLNACNRHTDKLIWKWLNGIIEDINDSPGTNFTYFRGMRRHLINESTHKSIFYTLAPLAFDPKKTCLSFNCGFYLQWVRLKSAFMYCSGIESSSSDWDYSKCDTCSRHWHIVFNPSAFKTLFASCWRWKRDSKI